MVEIAEWDYCVFSPRVITDYLDVVDHWRLSFSTKVFAQHAPYFPHSVLIILDAHLSSLLVHFTAASLVGSVPVSNGVRGPFSHIPRRHV